MNEFTVLRQPLLQRIFGRIEVETILKKIRGQKLKQTEMNYLSRSIRPKLAAALLLAQTTLSQKISGRKKEDTAAIEYNLRKYGIPLSSLYHRRTRLMALEDLIIYILVYSPHPRYIEAIPLLLVKHTPDAFRLLDLASQYGINNKIGYLLETANLLKPKEEYAPLLSYLEKTKDARTDFLAEGDSEFLLKTTPTRLRKWNLLGRFFDEDFRRNAEVYL